VYEVEYGIVGECSDSDTGSEMRPDLLLLIHRIGGPVVYFSFVFGLFSGSGQTCRHAQNIRVTLSDSGHTAASVSHRWS
jgi:hypothetical protein